MRDLTGKTQVEAAKRSGEIQRSQAFQSAEDVAAAGGEAGTLIGEAGQQAGGLLDPFADVGQRGVDLAGFLGDPTAQFDFLQNNPLFQSALQNANLQTQQRAASRGRLSSGDTLEQLSANTLQTARPFIQDQRSDILNLLNLGRGVATERGGILQDTGVNRANLLTSTAGNVANLQTGGTAAQAAGIVAAANARGKRAANVVNLATGGLSGQLGITPTGQAPGGQNTGVDVAGLVKTGASFFSDKNLKDNITIIGSQNGHNLYKWTWNKLANTLGLFGRSHGVIAQHIKEINPEAVSYENGFMKVDYKMIGVNHG